MSLTHQSPVSYKILLIEVMLQQKTISQHFAMHEKNVMNASSVMELFV